jgi:hypothetical protein
MEGENGTDNCTGLRSSCLQPASQRRRVDVLRLAQPRPAQPMERVGDDVLLWMVSYCDLRTGVRLLMLTCKRWRAKVAQTWLTRFVESALPADAARVWSAPMFARGRGLLRFLRFHGDADWMTNAPHASLHTLPLTLVSAKTAGRLLRLYEQHTPTPAAGVALHMHRRYILPVHVYDDGSFVVNALASHTQGEGLWFSECSERPCTDNRHWNESFCPANEDDNGDRFGELHRPLIRALMADGSIQQWIGNREARQILWLGCHGADLLLSGDLLRTLFCRGVSSSKRARQQRERARLHRTDGSIVFDGSLHSNVVDGSDSCPGLHSVMSVTLGCPTTRRNPPSRLQRNAKGVYQDVFWPPPSTDALRWRKRSDWKCQFLDIRSAGHPTWVRDEVPTPLPAALQATHERRQGSSSVRSCIWYAWGACAELTSTDLRTSISHLFNHSPVR